MPAISKIRFTNVVYEDGHKRYNDDLFRFEGHNGAVVLENGGGKTVFIQTLVQAIIPHTDLGERKIRDTLKLEGPAHIAIEWIVSEKPRRYVVTAVSLFLTDNKLDSLRYVYEYGANDLDSLERIPFVTEDGKRAVERYEIQEYYAKKVKQSPLAKTFSTIKSYRSFLEENYHIISDEWESIVKINKNEGGIEAFFDNCKIEKHLYDRLLIPTVEASISGFDEKQFADTFEEQQKSFKLYKELRSQIEEYEAIEGELTGFVQANEVLHSIEQNYAEQKANAKGVYSLAEQQREKVEQELVLQEKSSTELETELHSLKSRQDSYAIGLQNEKHTHMLSKYKELETERDRLERKVYLTRKQRYSLELAKQQAIVEGQANLALYYREEIGRLDHETDAQELSDELNEVRRAMKGHFIEKEDHFNKDMRGLEIELRPIEEEIISCKSEEEALVLERIRLEKEMTEKETRIDTLEDSMQRIRRVTLSNIEQEAVASLLPEWAAEQTKVDETIVSIQNGAKKSRERLVELKVKRVELQKGFHEESIVYAQIQGEVGRAEAAHANQQIRLANLSFSFSRIDSLYRKQVSTEESMQLKITNMKEDKENKLANERLAYRFIDDYDNQDTFFADPFMERQLSSWSSRIGLIETGVGYLSKLGLRVDEQLNKYPYWPVTLITTEDKKKSLIERVESVQNRLAYPIHVIDLQQAKAIVENNGSTHSEVVLPLHWKGNGDEEAFHSWKETLRTQAIKTKEERQEVEFVLRLWESELESFQTFLNTFPYDQVKENEEKEDTLRNHLQTAERHVARVQKEIDELEVEITVQELRIVDLKDKFHGLTGKIVDGRRHELELKEVVGLRGKLENSKIDARTLDVSVSKLKRRFDAFLEERDYLHEKLSSVRMSINILKQDSYYKAVINEKPIFNEQQLDVLIERTERIQLALNKVSSSRRELETKRLNAQEKQSDAEQVVRQIKEDWKDFDEGLVFPESGDMQIEQYRDRLRQELVLLQQAENSITSQKTEVAVVNVKLEELRNDFKRSHHGEPVILFTEPLHVVKNMLTLQRTQLVSKQEEFSKRFSQLKKEEEDISKALRKLAAFEESDHFNASCIMERNLTGDEEITFTYSRMSIADKVTTAMRRGRNAVEEERNRVTRKRGDFNDYVRRNMSDAKMRDNLIQGLEHKRNYVELNDFHQNIRSKMNSIIRVNEESIREHDERLGQFVMHMHEHARMVVRELEVIPTKTRIKFGADTKQMFTFRIPEWEENEGLARLRAYIVEILIWIDHPRYIDPDAKVNRGKIRTDVEKWFATPQLLRILLPSGDMKVSCRKVTNDNEVTSKSFSWRESNEWSGGEKWSKNMTLFLGLLNYVAEKKKLLDTSMKRNRSVILDNPFGKASSEHVLSPVFFIAEKLGFQIIALTAHAEGKFLRDYFPVIYSCRLRVGQNTSKQIMTKVKTINHAYFQDHEPIALERLGDSEQLSLLDS